MAKDTKQQGKMDMEAAMEVYRKLATPTAPPMRRNIGCAELGATRVRL